MTPNDDHGAASCGRYHLSANRFCENVGRAHRSNNVIICVDLEHSVTFQMCHDPDCQGFRGLPRPLPPDAAEDVLAVLSEEAIADAEADSANSAKVPAPPRP